MTIRNWFIGAYIIEYEQNGIDRAAYGTQLIKKLANDLKNRNIKSLSDRNLKNFRQFALTYPALAKDENITAFLSLISIPFNALQIRQTVAAEFKTAPQNLFPALQARELENPSLSWQDSNYYQRLVSTISWSHLVELTRIEDTTKRAFYELECMISNWSKRELKRQINSMLYERIGLSKDNFYLNYLKENIAYPHENAPVGILLCAEKDAEAVHYATAGLDNQLFVSRYMVALPSEEILKQWLIEEQIRLENQFNFDSKKERR